MHVEESTGIAYLPFGPFSGSGGTLEILDVSDPDNITRSTAEAIYSDLTFITGSGIPADFTFNGKHTYSVSRAFGVRFTTRNTIDGHKAYQAKIAGEKFVDNAQWDFSQGDRIGLVSFNQAAIVEQILTSTPQFVKDAFGPIPIGGWTDIGDGIDAATQQFIDNPNPTNPNALRFIVLLSDGISTEGSSGPAADRATLEGIVIYPVGFGQGADPTELTNIASITGGQYFAAASDGTALETVLDIIALQIGGGVGGAQGNVSKDDFETCIETGVCPNITTGNTLIVKVWKK